MPTTLGKTTPPGWTSPDQAKEQTDTARRRAQQSIREYALICCCSSACVQCLGLTGACAACSHCTATAWELSDLDPSHAATPQRVTRASCAQHLRSDFCAWRRLLLICWKLLIGVCVALGGQGIRRRMVLGDRIRVGRVGGDAEDVASVEDHVLHLDALPYSRRHGVELGRAC